MIKKRIVLIPIAVLMLLASCRAGRMPVLSRKDFAGEEEYISSFKDLAISEMHRTGVPASITLAQGIIESDFGRSRLAREANNHFGIKCHDDWSGPVIRHNDDRRNECFRKYSHPEESFKDHSDFLRSEPRYKKLFSLDVKDYKGWAAGLKKSGYATNPDYAQMLIKKIEEFNLERYDGALNALNTKESGKDVIADRKESATSETDAKKEDRPKENFVAGVVHFRIQEKNRIQYIIVKDSDTKESLEKEFQLLRWELGRYNELPSGFKLSSGQILFLQPKRERAEIGSEYHIVANGETMYSVSQLYGIKLKNLLLMNRMEDGQDPVVGQKLWLRSTKPVD